MGNSDIFRTLLGTQRKAQDITGHSLEGQEFQITFKALVVYQCFEDEAKKLCANIVFEFSLNPIPMFNTNSNNAQNPGILGTGMAVCNPNFPGLDEKVYLLIPITIVFNKTDIQDTSDVYCLSLS